MKVQTTYQQQANEIEAIANEIVKNAKAFANKKHNSPYYQDLLFILSELKELNK